MAQRRELLDKRFERLSVKKYIGSNRHGNALWECVCDCGTICIVKGTNLWNGGTKSCGCLQKETARRVCQEMVDKRENQWLGWIISPFMRGMTDGLMLGDGNIRIGANHRNGLCKIGLVHRIPIESYKTIFVNEGFSFGIRSPYCYETSSPNGKICWTWEITSRVHPFFTEQYHRWYPEGKKIIPKDLVLTPLPVKHWYYGDGGLTYEHGGTKNAYFSTQGFTFGDCEFLCFLFKKTLGINPRIDKVKRDSGKIQPKIVVNKSQIPNLLSYIGPCDPEFSCYSYKWIIDNRELYNYHKNNCPCLGATNA